MKIQGDGYILSNENQPFVLVLKSIKERDSTQLFPSTLTSNLIGSGLQWQGIQSDLFLAHIQFASQQ